MEARRASPPPAGVAENQIQEAGRLDSRQLPVRSGSGEREPYVSPSPVLSPRMLHSRPTHFLVAALLVHAAAFGLAIFNFSSIGYGERPRDSPRAACLGNLVHETHAALVSYMQSVHVISR